MTHTYKGVVLGIANVVAVAAVIGATVAMHTRTRTGAEAFVMVGVLGILPGIFAGAFLGWLAGQLPAFRAVILSAIAVSGVMILGSLTEPELILRSCIPTIIAATVLAWWTSPRDPDRSDLLPAPIKGMVLGFANVLAIATLLGFTVAITPPTGWEDPEELGWGYHHGPTAGSQIALLVLFIGVVPGTALGALLGWIASRVGQLHRGWRLAILAVPALLVVMQLGVLTNHAELIVPSGIPTLAGCAILEQWTRRRLALPLATLR
ncbi:MAG: hypothetical protein ABI867_10525 [Kofleriaceae bacterium]